VKLLLNLAKECRSFHFSKSSASAFSSSFWNQKVGLCTFIPSFAFVGLSVVGASKSRRKAS